MKSLFMILNLEKLLYPLLRDQGVKTELISKKENISLDEYTTFKKEDGATKITYVSKDGAVEL